MSSISFMALTTPPKFPTPNDTPTGVSSSHYLFNDARSPQALSQTPSLHFDNDLQIQTQYELCPIPEKTYYDPIIKNAIENINNSPHAKLSNALPTLVLGIQKRRFNLLLSDISLQYDIAKLKKLNIEGLNNDKLCEEFISAIYHLSKHKKTFLGADSSSKKATNHITAFLKRIGYVHKQTIRLCFQNKFKSGFYSGFQERDAPHGFGIVTWGNGMSYYEGNFLNGVFDQFGVLISQNASELNSTQHLQHVLKECKDDIADFVRSFKIIFSNSYMYVHMRFNADFSNNYSGQYTGFFSNGYLHGHGVLTDKEGQQYEGSFLSGKQHGFAVKSCINGIVSQDESPEQPQEIPADFLQNQQQLREKIKAHYAPTIAESTPLPDVLFDIVAEYL